MKATAIVAHPDDCLIFARQYIDTHPMWKWSIVYLTYNATDDRAIEIAAYWNKRNVVTTFLGYVDSYSDMETGVLSFSVEKATQAIHNAVTADIVLTHNADGDYGHIHHKFVSEVVSQIDKPTVYFANTTQYNIECKATSSLNFEEFPLHKEVLQMFDNLDVGHYYN